MLCLLSSSGLLAQEAPVIQCVSVEGDDVRITWQGIDDPDAIFDDLEVYRYNPVSGLNTLLATYTDVNQTEHFQIGTLAANEAILYFLTASYGAETFNSDTVSTIDLNLSAIVDFSVARLTWKQFITPQELEPFLYYVVQINYDGNWSDIDTLAVDELSLSVDAFGETIAFYTRAIQVCHLPAVSVPVSFRLQLFHQSGCIGQSNEQEEDFQDATGPTAPLIETVSVDTMTNQAIIYWYPSPEGDIGAYRVLDENDVQLVELTDPSILSYQYPLSDAGANSEGFYVVPLDTCGNRGSVDQQVPHFTILPELEFIICDRAIRITWNDYEEWPDGVRRYVVYGGLSGTAMQVLDTVSANANGYTFANVDVLTNYSFVVKALPFDERRPSLSAKQEIFTQYPDLPDFNYLANVSVIARNEVELKVLVDPAATRTRYRFQKLDIFGEDFDELITRSQTAADADGFITVVDADVDPGSTIYSYRVAIVDSCGFEDSYSNVSSNIRLTVIADSESRTNTLTWTDYGTWDGQVQTYRIFRSETMVFPNVPYATVTGDRTYFTDNVDTEIDYIEQAQYCYTVQAVESGNSYGFDQRSTSNAACAVQEYLMFIPNAIVVGGANGVFRPIGGYFDRDRYLLQVFDRWGRLLHESTDIDTGWDGTSSEGNPVPEGVYAYRIVFFRGNGQEITRNGTITVLYAP
ncbi:MAG: gliding motility-associated C-terminal domain-containing protein [Bacteroidetes bacterium]|nr:gliding motility-associated C-terminal domain-containing protein [Bacteroidota bacterium]